MENRLKQLRTEFGNYDHYTDGFDEGCVAVEDAPAADVVEVVHGEWVPRKIMSRHPGAKNYYCSICETITAETGKYCGNCGAKMDGERKEV